MQTTFVAVLHCPTLLCATVTDMLGTFFAFYRLFCVHFCIFSLWRSGLVLMWPLEMKKIFWRYSHADTETRHKYYLDVFSLNKSYLFLYYSFFLRFPWSPW